MSWKEIENDIQSNWGDIPEYVITRLGSQGFVLKAKPFTHNEVPICHTYKQHGKITMAVVKGRSKRRSERMVGYYLLYTDRPVISLYPNYLAISYTPLEDVRYKAMEVIHSDDHTRLLKFGIGVFDYLWACRKKSPLHHQEGMPQCAAHLRFKKSWRDGM
jgi:hypothetical protein